MAQKMRAVRLFAPKDIRCVEVDIPQIEKDTQVLIKVKSCGVCGSDIPRVMVKGTYHFPTTIGHEFSGQIVECGTNVRGNLKPGDRVSVMPLIPCGTCQFCKVGQSHLCDHYDYYGSRRDGAMAEYIVVESENCLKLPQNVTYEMGALTDPISVALHAVRKVRMEAGKSAAVFGLGAIGYLCVQWLRELGCTRVIAVDVADEKLRLAKELGATDGINGMKVDAVKAVKELTGGEGVDIAIEFAGNKITHVQAVEACKKNGEVVYGGITYDDVAFPNKAIAAILRGELTIHGSWNSSINPLPINEWMSGLEYMNLGKIIVEPLITHRVRLEDCKEVFDMMFNRTEVFTKVLFLPELI